MYFDAVLYDGVNPVFNGTPEETKEWLRNNIKDPDANHLSVCIGQTLATVSVADYLNSK